MSIKASEAIHSLQPVKRFLPGSKLFDVTGSVPQRQAHKAMLHENFNKLLDDAFEKSDEISLDELKGIYKKVIPEIKLEINNQSTARGGVSVTSKNDKSIDGLKLGLGVLNNTTKLCKGDEAVRSIIDHENGHIFTLITEPKFLLNFVSEPLSEGAALLQFHLYKTKLYSQIDDNISLLGNNDKSSKVKRFLNSFFMESKKDKFKTDENYRKKLYIKEIKQFFKKNKFDKYETIEILKRWRRLLIGEKEAYTDQANLGADRLFKGLEKNIKSALNIDIDFLASSEKLEGHSDEFKEVFNTYIASKSEFKENNHKTYVEAFDFDGKIAVIEEMFLERVSKVRAGFKEKYGN